MYRCTVLPYKGNFSLTWGFTPQSWVLSALLLPAPFPSLSTFLNIEKGRRELSRFFASSWCIHASTSSLSKGDFSPCQSMPRTANISSSTLLTSLLYILYLMSDGTFPLQLLLTCHKSEKKSNCLYFIFYPFMNYIIIFPSLALTCILLSYLFPELSTTVYMDTTCVVGMPRFIFLKLILMRECHLVVKLFSFYLWFRPALLQMLMGINWIEFIFFFFHVL